MAGLLAEVCDEGAKRELANLPVGFPASPSPLLAGVVSRWPCASRRCPPRTTSAARSGACSDLSGSASATSRRTSTRREARFSVRWPRQIRRSQRSCGTPASRSLSGCCSKKDGPCRPRPSASASLPTICARCSFGSGASRRVTCAARSRTSTRSAGGDGRRRRPTGRGCIDDAASTFSGSSGTSDASSVRYRLQVPFARGLTLR